MNIINFHVDLGYEKCNVLKKQCATHEFACIDEQRRRSRCSDNNRYPTTSETIKTKLIEMAV